MPMCFTSVRWTSLCWWASLHLPWKEQIAIVHNLTGRSNRLKTQFLSIKTKSKEKHLVFVKHKNISFVCFTFLVESLCVMKFKFNIQIAFLLTQANLICIQPKNARNLCETRSKKKNILSHYFSYGFHYSNFMKCNNYKTIKN